MKAFLTVRGLARYFGNFYLGPLSFDLAARDYMVLLGPTGCGKSSLLNMLAGIQGPFQPNTVLLGGRDIGGLPPQQRRVGYVIQGDNLFPHLTVRDNIAFGLKYLKLPPREARRRLERMLALFGLQAQEQQPVHTLSGGEKRKTAMARCLLVDPQLLLLDEPLSMLDHNGRQEILHTLKMIHAELKTTTIHVTHDRLEAWSIAQT
ncbi:ATP-binding cassette domain-containing protein, partial [candidate division FCPU426 bacterium]|nr:ATP-binding cassette domain-containing protein [candidate division FCPU426 bacterium]